MLKLALLSATTLLSFILSAQEIKGRVLDNNTNPVIFAAIQSDKNSGVISNEEGFFTIVLNQKGQNKLTISCLGFVTKSVAIADLKANDYIIVLKEQVNQLDEVFLSNKTPDAAVIIRKVNENLRVNYQNEDLKYKLFFRETSYNDFSKIQFEIDKASGIKKQELASVNKSLDSLTTSIKNNESIKFKDYLAELMLLNQENSKLKVIKATQLIDRKKDISIEEIQEKAQRLFLKYLDTTKTYKLKTGLIKIEDSLSFKDSKLKEPEEDTFEYEVADLRSASHEQLQKSQIYDNTILKNILDKNLYKYDYLSATVYDNELVHIIAYSPKRSKSKFEGQLYISDDSFAVLKLDYNYAKGKRGQKINLRLLLGFKYVENLKKGPIIYNKNTENKYQPKYIKEESGSYFYVHRPIKFIENSRAKNKVSLDFLIEGNQRDKSELFIIEYHTMTKDEYSRYEEVKHTEYKKIKNYDPTIWAEFTALEPLQEMKSFRSEK
jgi:hypothetical protein